jgi:hypothetical protein
MKRSALRLLKVKTLLHVKRHVIDINLQFIACRVQVKYNNIHSISLVSPDMNYYAHNQSSTQNTAGSGAQEQRTVTTLVLHCSHLQGEPPVSL